MPNVRSTYSDGVHFYGFHTPIELLKQFGSPLYVYNENILRRRCAELRKLCAHPGFSVNYSTKANANPALLRIIREEGLVVDAMSPGELHMVQDWAGFSSEEILYVCNNVSADELRNAVDRGVLVSVDSLSQLELLGGVAPGGEAVVRLNPGIGAGHHQKVVTGGKESKFGVSLEDIPELRRILERYDLKLVGVNQHIGSLFMRPDEYLAAVDVVLHVVETEFMGACACPRSQMRLIDFGGGFGIPYRKYAGEARLDLAELGVRLDEKLRAFSARTGYAGRFLVEPGRYVVAECGAVLSWVNAVKQNGVKRFVGTDIGFNVLARPMLYDSFHDIEIFRENGAPDDQLMPQTVVGNICESGDILARERELPELREGDALAMLDAGAYGFTMASTYNQRLRPAEVLIGADGSARLIRRRETLEDLTVCFPDERA